MPDGGKLQHGPPLVRVTRVLFDDVHVIAVGATQARRRPTPDAVRQLPHLLRRRTPPRSAGALVTVALPPAEALRLVHAVQTGTLYCGLRGAGSRVDHKAIRQRHHRRRQVAAGEAGTRIMTLLWEADPLAADNLRLALGDDMRVVESGPAVVRHLGENRLEWLLVVGPDIDLGRGAQPHRAAAADPPRRRRGADAPPPRRRRARPGAARRRARGRQRRRPEQR